LTARPPRRPARLDIAEVARSRWMYFCVAVYAALGAIFVFVALRESNVLGFTGMSRVLMSFCHAIILLLPLLALTATGHVVNKAREDGTIELLFSHPLSHAAYFGAAAVVRFGVLVLPLAGLLVGMAIIGRLAFGEAIPVAFVARTIAISAAILWAFVGAGLAISVFVRNTSRATMYLVLTWALAVTLVDFALAGLMLQWRLNPQSVFVLASLNPVQAARMALLSSAEPELAVLGPVGFYLANRIGAGALFALGVLWPLVAGCAALFAGYWRFRSDDLV
ncbi:ABC transporter permease, partial [bacterium]|nr:ABC transporter permease [bacterium]